MKRYSRIVGIPALVIIASLMGCGGSSGSIVPNPDNNSGNDSGNTGGGNGNNNGDNNGTDGNSRSLRNGAVFSMSNAAAGNEVAAFFRAGDGQLELAGRYPTGGTGSGSFEDSANGLVLGSARGESSPNNLIDDAELLFVTNAGSNSITVFNVNDDDLSIVETQDSGGEKPVSVTVNRGLMYVLHSGETTDTFTPMNCADPTATPSITGFTVDDDGNLTPIPNSTRTLSGDDFSGCAQVSFNPSGDVLVVTERFAVDPPAANDMSPAGDEGLIVTYNVNPDGTLGNKQLFDATGQGPFGFTFSKSGNLLTSEQFDGPMGPMLGAAAGYRLNRNGGLVAQGASVNNGGTDTCWLVLTDNGQFAYTSSFFNPTPRISSYRVDNQGGLTLLEPVAGTVPMGAADLALSGDSQYLYNINASSGMLTGWRIEDDGQLTQIQTIQAQVAPTAGQFGVLGLAAH